MSFTPGMPASGSSLGNTRVPFVNELAGIRSTMAANHVDQNATGAGKHTFSQFVNVADGITGPTELGWYNKSNGVAQRFFMRQPSNGTIIQMSGVDPVINSNAGCTFLPGGLFLQWGGGSTSGTSTTVTFAKGNAAGFKLFTIIGLSLANNTKTYGAINNPSSTFNDGFKFVTPAGAGFGFGYCVIGTLA